MGGKAAVSPMPSGNKAMHVSTNNNLTAVPNTQQVKYGAAQLKLGTNTDVRLNSPTKAQQKGIFVQNNKVSPIATDKPGTGLFDTPMISQGLQNSHSPFKGKP